METEDRDIQTNKDDVDFRNGNSPYYNNKYTEKNKQYVKKMLGTNDHLNLGNTTNYEIVCYKLNIILIWNFIFLLRINLFVIHMLL